MRQVKEVEMPMESAVNVLAAFVSSISRDVCSQGSYIGVLVFAVCCRYSLENATVIGGISSSRKFLLCFPCPHPAMQNGSLLPSQWFVSSRRRDLWEHQLWRKMHDYFQPHSIGITIWARSRQDKHLMMRAVVPVRQPLPQWSSVVRPGQEPWGQEAP